MMSRTRTLAIFCAAAAAAILPLACELVVDPSNLDNGGPLVAADGSSDSSIDTSAPDDGGPQKDGSTAIVDGGCGGEAGPAMVRVGAFCIDSTEVTNADYEAFLASNPSPSIGPPSCAWKADFDHGGTWVPPNPGSSAPAGNVDWCDAFVYCTWAGKRLCGNPDGGSTPYASFADQNSDEWFFACSAGDASTYPYGSAFQEKTCNGKLADGGFQGGSATYHVNLVAQEPACLGGFPGIFDMSGNVAEWEDCCDDSPGGDAAAQTCRMRGGSANSDSSQLTCAFPASFGPYQRGSVTDDLGFRCCSP